jgi:hypothetical protein
MHVASLSWKGPLLGGKWMVKDNDRLLCPSICLAAIGFCGNAMVKILSIRFLVPFSEGFTKL